MLVRFESDQGSLTLFGAVAVTLLKMMGQSGALIERPARPPRNAVF